MSFRKILFVHNIFAFLMISVAGIANAQDLVAAKVLTIEGQVEVRRQQENQPLIQKIAFKIDDTLKTGDTVITGKNGRLVLGLSDGSQAVIAPKTTVVIDDLSKSPRTLFNVIKGKTRIHIEKLGGRPNPYRVNTPTAVIAVRGTIFDVLASENETQVFLHEGEVAVTNLRTPDQQVILSAGQMTRILMSRQPNRPSSFKTGRNDDTFKLRGNDRSSADNRRIANSNSRPESGRGGNRSDSDSKPDFGRAAPNSNGRTQPDFGRGGPQTSSSGPGGGQKSGGKRP